MKHIHGSNVQRKGDVDGSIPADSDVNEGSVSAGNTVPGVSEPSSSNAPNLEESSSSQSAVPDQSSTPQGRRKRGLSLRSQLFNKAISSRLISPSLFDVSIEMDEIDDMDKKKLELNSNRTPVSTIKEGTSSSNSTTLLQWNDVPRKHLSPYSASSAQVSSESIASDTSSVEFLPRKNPSFASAFTFLRDKILGPPPPKPPNRIIPISYENSGEQYVNNLITSSKYSVYSFIPKQLKAQFSKVANVYFLCVAIMQMIPSWSTTGQFTTIIPLSIFISISIAREGFDDWRRHLMDREENNRTAYKLVEPGEGPSITITDMDDTSESTSDIYSMSTNTRDVPPMIDIKWKDVKVGDILRIPCDLAVPADILVLNVEPLIRVSDDDSTEENDSEAVAYIETMDLDGETNLKPRQAPPVSYNGFYYGTATVENPNLDLYNFEGVLTTGLDSIPIGPENVIYRGSIIRNTNAVIGLVIFTGEETKIRMNNIKNPRTKAPKLQRAINIIVLFMVIVVISLSAFSLMAQKIMYSQNVDKTWYLYRQDVGTAATLFGFIIMYNTLIPLSLYVTMEIIKVGQLLLLQYDIDMYHKESNTPADAKTATILEELGQVGYVFSDKTGTLTENKMIFKGLTVGGAAFLHGIDKESEASQNKPQSPTSKNSKLSTEKLLELLHSPSIFASKAKFFLLCIALCSTAVPSRNDDTVTYLASSPDEKALVEGARDLGYVVWDKNRKVLTLKTYPHGFDNEPLIEQYTVLEVIEFLSARKRMSIVVQFPDGRICVICKGADTIVMDLLKSRELANKKAHELTLAANRRKQEQADVVILDRLSRDESRFSREGRFSLEGGRFSREGGRFSHESRTSLGSLRRSMQLDSRTQTAATLLSLDQVVAEEVNDIAVEARRSLQLDQERRYYYHEDTNVFPDDRLVLNEEFVLEKTLQHVEEFSIEGLRTLVYGSRWLEKSQYDDWIKKYKDARTALDDRAERVEQVGSEIECNLELVGATAIEDKLQDGVPDAINKLRLAGIKMWMLTGDKRETAINIGHSCGLIKDYSTIVVLAMTLGMDSVRKEITTTTTKIKGGSTAHCVVVIDGATLGTVQENDLIMAKFVDLCLVADLAICCRASPSQKAAMVSAVRDASRRGLAESIKSPFKKGNSTGVTLAIGDGANDIAMIQSADIGVGITGKEGLQAARSADYAIAQFRFIVKLLLVNGRYNYVRTLKFVLCTFYKELIFYLTQCCYQRWTLFSGLSVYESWSLSMYNTLFTSLCVLVVGIFDRDLHASTLVAVPQLYATGRESQIFNFWVFVRWMIGASIQSVGISFMSWYLWGLTALKDNTTLGLGTGLFGALVIIINAKCVFIETQNRTWLSFAAFIISVGGYGIWNVLIMILYRSSYGKIFYVEYGLYHFARDSTWWAMLLALSVVPMYADILVKIFQFVVSPSDVAIFQALEKDMEYRSNFEQIAFPYLSQGWSHKEPTSLKKWLVGVEQRKRAGTESNPLELPPSGDGVALHSDYEVLPSGKRFKRKKDDIEAILRDRMD